MYIETDSGKPTSIPRFKPYKIIIAVGIIMILFAALVVGVVTTLGNYIMEKGLEAIDETMTNIADSENVLYYELSDDEISVIVHRDDAESVGLYFKPNNNSIAIFNPETPETMEVYRSEDGYFIKYIEAGDDGLSKIAEVLSRTDELKHTTAEVHGSYNGGRFSCNTFGDYLDEIEIITSYESTLIGNQGDTTWVVTDCIDGRVINQLGSKGIDFQYPDLDISKLEDGDVKDILVDAFGDVGLLDYIKY